MPKTNCFCDTFIRRGKVFVSENPDVARFRGFYGDYKPMIRTNGKTIPTDFKLSKDDTGKKVIRLQ